MFTFIIIFWTADHDPFGKTSKLLSDGDLILTGLSMPLFILCSLMVDTIFVERNPAFHDSMKVWVEIYNTATMLYMFSSIFAPITYGLLPLLIIGALAARFRSCYLTFSIFPFHSRRGGLGGGEHIRSIRPRGSLRYGGYSRRSRGKRNELWGGDDEDVGYQ
jgi:hypothetical protein